MLDLLFVYGTLRSGFDNPWAKLLRERAELLGPATVRGAIYRIHHYPGFRPESAPGTGGVVHGEVFHLFPDPAALLKALDEYEDADFTRVLVDIEQGGAAATAWIYRYDAALPPDSLIPSGNFCA
jgi:gamma-glutamylcyclotransferase (GGCT)/AIG2-like uncharacterized protein YtfP